MAQGGGAQSASRARRFGALTGKEGVGKRGLSAPFTNPSQVLELPFQEEAGGLVNFFRLSQND